MPKPDQPPLNRDLLPYQSHQPDKRPEQSPQHDSPLSEHTFSFRRKLLQAGVGLLGCGYLLYELLHDLDSTAGSDEAKGRRADNSDSSKTVVKRKSLPMQYRHSGEVSLIAADRDGSRVYSYSDIDGLVCSDGVFGVTVWTVPQFREVDEIRVLADGSIAAVSKMDGIWKISSDDGGLLDQLCVSRWVAPNMRLNVSSTGEFLVSGDAQPVWNGLEYVDVLPSEENFRRVTLKSTHDFEYLCRDLFILRVGKWYKERAVIYDAQSGKLSKVEGEYGKIFSRSLIPPSYLSDQNLLVSGGKSKRPYERGGENDWIRVQIHDLERGTTQRKEFSSYRELEERPGYGRYTTFVKTHQQLPGRALAVVMRNGNAPRISTEHYEHRYELWDLLEECLLDRIDEKALFGDYYSLLTNRRCTFLEDGSGVVVARDEEVALWRFQNNILPSTIKNSATDTQ